MQKKKRKILHNPPPSTKRITANNFLIYHPGLISMHLKISISLVNVKFCNLPFSLNIVTQTFLML